VRQHTRARVERIRAAEEDVRREEEVKEQRGREKFEMGGEAARSKREARARIKAEKAKAVGQAENMFVQEEQPPPASPCPESTPTSLGHFHEVPSYPLSPSLNLGPPITSLPHPLFPFPATPRDRALVQTFTTLNSLNLRMGLGPRFGGEYLIYPGDYLRYHAHFKSQVLVRDQCIRPGEIVAWGRLGTGTKKAGLICCWDDGVREGTALEEEEREGEVDFYSLEWANFG